MTNASRPGRGSAFSIYWQLPLLRVMLRSTGLSGVLAPLIASAVSRSFRPEYWLSEFTGVGLLVLSFVRFERARLVALTYVGIALVTALIFGAWFGWMPDVVVVLGYLVVAGGLLFGPRFARGMVLLIALLLVCGGVAVQAGVYSVVPSSELDPTRFSSWLRTALGYALLTGAAAWVLLEAIAAVARAEAEASQALMAAQSSLEQTKASRNRRLREEQALLDAQKLHSVAQLGDGFAHVVSNLLTVVRCGCEDARRNESDDSRRAAARAIREATRDCAHRTRDLLLLSRPHSSEPETIELHREVLAQADSIRRRLRSNIHCEFDAEQAGTALVPRSWVPQILTNLLLNAADAIRGAGTIKVSTRSLELNEALTSAIDRLEPGVYATLEVRDSGEGMTPEVIQHACEPFFTTRGRAGHDGLGLTLAHSMARQIGGTLGLHSDGPGARVTVYFPSALRAADSTAVTRPRAPASHTPLRPQAPARSTRNGNAAPPLVSDEAAPATHTEGSAPPARPSASTLPPGDDWLVGALTRTVNTLMVASVLGALALAFLLEGEWIFPSLLALSMAPLMLLVRDPRRLPHQQRLLVLLGSLLLVGGTFVAHYSFMSPGAVGVLTQIVFLACVFGGRRIASWAVLATTVTFLGAGALWHARFVANPMQDLVADSPHNWFRISLILPTLLLVSGHMVLDMFRVAADRVRALDRARRKLERRRRQHQSATEALLRVEGMRGRAERTATAGRLTGVVAHDLNNSLMALQGWAEFLEESTEPDEALQSLEQAMEHTEALLQSLRGTTEFGHRGAGLDLSLALVRAGAMLEAVWQTEPAQRCTLAFETESGCFVDIQEASFRRLLVNLVTNARQALAERAGACTVRVCQGASGVEVSVVDTGPGMDSATRERIFEPFFTTKSSSGTGLGLLSVAEIVEATGGTLAVESQLGRGSTFAIRWPLAEAGAAPAAVSARVEARSASARILLAEDEPLVRRLLAQGLRSAGYDVTEADDGDAAVRCLSVEGPFDALCTDAVMPGRPVADVIAEYRASHANGAVLVLSGYLPQDLTPLVSSAGVSLLRKPVSHSELAAALERLRPR